MDESRNTSVTQFAHTRHKKARASGKPGAGPSEVSAEIKAATAAAPGLSRVGGLPVDKAASLASSAALVGVGLLLESELLAGIAIGTGIVLAAKLVPEPISGAILPVVNGTLKACYSAAAKMGELVGEAVEGIEGAVGIGGKREETS